MLLLNLDHFKLVNDSLGHSAGDAMLVKVSERLVGIASSGDTVARLGGDEFALLMEGDADASGMVAQRVVEAFDRPFVIDGQDLLVRPSVGLAIAAVHNVDVAAGELLRRAEVAMYSANGLGPASWSRSHRRSIRAAARAPFSPPPATALTEKSVRRGCWANCAMPSSISG